MTVAGLILSAGASRRMGSPKALLEIQGETFLNRLIRFFSESCSSVTVVLGHEWQELRPSGAAWVVNPNPELGMLSSLQTGLRALPPGYDGVLLTPVDYPSFEASTVQSVVGAFSGREPFVRPRFDGRNGHPILFASAIVSEFLHLPVTMTARDVVHRYASETLYVDVNDPGILRDVDDPGEYARLLAGISAS